MSALPTKTQPSSGTRTQLEESLADDAVLARLVQQGLRDLARHSCAYAAVFASKRGARLAHHLTVGDIDQLSESGRRTLANLYRLTQAALTVEPGLDTNTLVDRVTGRRDPRREIEHEAGDMATARSQLDTGLALNDHIRMLTAIVCDAQHQRSAAMESVDPAFVSAGDADGYVRQFLADGEPNGILLQRGQGLGVAAEHPGRILAELDPAVPRQPLVDPLSMREMQVLKLLDSELSARGVALQLFVSHNTVRTHTRHIFAKLQVNTRRAAVLRAREYGLL
jgi:ATP/maltotriose-dependent transcriptional regulator MalT